MLVWMSVLRVKGKEGRYNCITPPDMIVFGPVPGAFFVGSDKTNYSKARKNGHQMAVRYYGALRKNRATANGL